MNKIFLTICLGLALCPFSDVLGKATAFDNLQQAQAHQEQNIRSNPVSQTQAPISSPADFKSMEKLIIQRLKNVPIMQLPPSETLNKPSSINMQHSDAYIAEMKNKNKSFLQKVYDNAIRRISDSETQQAPDSQQSDTQYVSFKPQDLPKLQAPDFPVVTVELPHGEKTLVPAQEHIPFLSTQIEILSDGLVSINDTLIVVAGEKKLKNGLAKIIAKNSFARDGRSHKIHLSLSSVSINGQEVPHKIVETSDSYIISPVAEYSLNSGIYTYNFQYVVDRQIWDYQDFHEFYWDATGSRWNLIIGKAIVTVRLPGQNKPLSAFAYTGYPDSLSNRGTFYENQDNFVAFASVAPLYIGEGFHILIDMPKDDFIVADRDQKITWFIEDYGDLLISLMGFGVILISYALSWKYISQNKNTKTQPIKRNSMLMRYLLTGKFDKTSLAAFLVELYRKNIIDIQRSENNILLVKRTDNLNILERNEKKAVKALFPKNESVLSLGTTAQLKIKRAYKILETDIQKQLKRLALKLNSQYLIFSVAMLLFAEIAISSLHTNMWQACAVVVSSSLTVAFYLFVLKRKFKSFWLAGLCKIFAILFIMVSILVMSTYIHTGAAILLFSTLCTIFAYSTLFAKRHGLIKSHIKEVMQYRDYLIRNAETIKLGRDFLTQQPLILALDLQEHFQKDSAIAEYYKLDMLDEGLSLSQKK